MNKLPILLMVFLGNIAFAEENTLPPLPPEIVNKATEKVVVVTPQEIKSARKIYQENKVALNDHLYSLKPLVSSIPLSNDPSAPIEVIRTTKGANTYVNFLDSMGNPWPYKLVTFGSKAYSEGVYGEQEGHVAEIVVVQDFIPSTFSVMLEGTDKPLIFMLTPSLDGEFDVSKTFVVPGQSTKSKTELAAHLKSAQESSILTRAPKLSRSLNLFLDNTPPIDEAIPLPVTDITGVQAWKYNNKIIVRTNKKLKWPEANVLNGVNGFRVYELSHATPTLTFIEKGQMRTAHIPDDALAGLPRLGSN